MSLISRRNFVKKTSVAALGLTLASFKNDQNNPAQLKTIKIGIIGTGNRGTALLNNLLKIKGVEIIALCDLTEERTSKASAICTRQGRQKPAIYSGDEKSYAKLLNNEKLDVVIIATYWDSHAPIALAAIAKGIVPGIEVPMALSVKDTWRLVEASEKRKVPFMMLENWSFRPDNLAVLNMKRAGDFGEIVHCHCAHSHDCIDHWFFDAKTGECRWPAQYLANFNRDQYPTHSVGPILSWMDINCGDVFTEIYSTAAASKGINAYMTRKFGAGHPNAKKQWRQGDIVTSTLKTKKGKTLVINYDMQLPRPYANRWMLQGTKGVYDEEKASIYLVDKSPDYHKWEAWKPYEDKHKHKWSQTDASGSHGGADFIMLREFITSLQNNRPLPLDIYDAAVMTAIVELSGLSIKKNAPVAFPDFTKGKWKNRQPYFAV